MDPNMSAKDFIKELFNIDMPIAGGYGENKQNAVKMLYEFPNDFINTEYLYLQCISKAMEKSYKVEGQELLHEGGYTYDKIQIETTYKKDGKTIVQLEDWYFDITDCFGKK